MVLLIWVAGLVKMTYEKTMQRVRELEDSGEIQIIKSKVYGFENEGEKLAEINPEGVVQIIYNEFYSLSGVQSRLELKESLEDKGVPYAEVFVVAFEEDVERAKETLNEHRKRLSDLVKRLDSFVIRKV